MAKELCLHVTHLRPERVLQGAPIYTCPPMDNGPTLALERAVPQPPAAASVGRAVPQHPAAQATQIPQQLTARNAAHAPTLPLPLAFNQQPAALGPRNTDQLIDRGAAPAASLGIAVAQQPSASAA